MPTFVFTETFLLYKNYIDHNFIYLDVSISIRDLR